VKGEDFQPSLNETLNSAETAPCIVKANNKVIIATKKKGRVIQFWSSIIMLYKEMQWQTHSLQLIHKWLRPRSGCMLFRIV